MQQHQLVTTVRRECANTPYVRAKQRPRSRCPLGWLVAQRRAVSTRPAPPEEPEDQPADECDQPEAGKAVKEHGSQRLAGAHAGGHEGQAESPLGHPEAAWRDVEALRGDPRAVDKQEVI